MVVASKMMAMATIEPSQALVKLGSGGLPSSFGNFRLDDHNVVEWSDADTTPGVSFKARKETGKWINPLNNADIQFQRHDDCKKSLHSKAQTRTEVIEGHAPDSQFQIVRSQTSFQDSGGGTALDEGRSRTQSSTTSTSYQMSSSKGYRSTSKCSSNRTTTKTLTTSSGTIRTVATLGGGPIADEFEHLGLTFQPLDTSTQRERINVSRNGTIGVRRPPTRRHTPAPTPAPVIPTSSPEDSEVEMKDEIIVDSDDNLRNSPLHPLRNGSANASTTITEITHDFDINTMDSSRSHPGLSILGFKDMSKIRVGFPVDIQLELQTKLRGTNGWRNNDDSDDGTKENEKTETKSVYSRFSHSLDEEEGEEGPKRGELIHKIVPNFRKVGESATSTIDNNAVPTTVPRRTNSDLETYPTRPSRPLPNSFRNMNVYEGMSYQNNAYSYPDTTLASGRSGGGSRLMSQEAGGPSILTNANAVLMGIVRRSPSPNEGPSSWDFVKDYDSTKEKVSDKNNNKYASLLSSPLGNDDHSYPNNKFGKVVDEESDKAGNKVIPIQVEKSGASCNSRRTIVNLNNFLDDEAYSKDKYSSETPTFGTTTSSNKFSDLFLDETENEINYFQSDVETPTPEELEGIVPMPLTLPLPSALERSRRLLEMLDETPKLFGSNKKQEQWEAAETQLSFLNDSLARLLEGSETKSKGDAEVEENGYTSSFMKKLRQFEHPDLFDRNSRSGTGPSRFSNKTVSQTWISPSDMTHRKVQDNDVTTSISATHDTSTTSSNNANLSKLKGTKRVEFCKTEVHFTPDSGQFRIVETDENKPSTAHLFRRKRKDRMKKQEQQQQLQQLCMDNNNNNDKSGGVHSSEVGESSNHTSSSQSQSHSSSSSSYFQLLSKQEDVKPNGGTSERNMMGFEEDDEEGVQEDFKLSTSVPFTKMKETSGSRLNLVPFYQGKPLSSSPTFPLQEERLGSQKPLRYHSTPTASRGRTLSDNYDQMKIQQFLDHLKSPSSTGIERELSFTFDRELDTMSPTTSYRTQHSGSSMLTENGSFVPLATRRSLIEMNNANHCRTPSSHYYSNNNVITSESGSSDHDYYSSSGDGGSGSEMMSNKVRMEATVATTARASPQITSVHLRYDFGNNNDQDQRDNSRLSDLIKRSYYRNPDLFLANKENNNDSTGDNKPESRMMAMSSTTTNSNNNKSVVTIGDYMVSNNTGDDKYDQPGSESDPEPEPTLSMDHTWKGPAHNELFTNTTIRSQSQQRSRGTGGPTRFDGSGSVSEPEWVIRARNRETKITDWDSVGRPSTSHRQTYDDNDDETASKSQPPPWSDDLMKPRHKFGPTERAISVVYPWQRSTDSSPDAMINNKSPSPLPSTTSGVSPSGEVVLHSAISSPTPIASLRVTQGDTKPQEAHSATHEKKSKSKEVEVVPDLNSKMGPVVPKPRSGKLNRALPEAPAASSDTNPKQDKSLRSHSKGSSKQGTRESSSNKQSSGKVDPATGTKSRTTDTKEKDRPHHHHHHHHHSDSKGATESTTTGSHSRTARKKWDKEASGGGYGFGSSGASPSSASNTPIHRHPLVKGQVSKLPVRRHLVASEGQGQVRSPSSGKSTSASSRHPSTTTTTATISHNKDGLSRKIESPYSTSSRRHVVVGSSSGKQRGYQDDTISKEMKRRKRGEDLNNNNM